ncbi:hypothetical protein PR003_g5743 [Phytophthora rubi]|uniref:Uncharacterized protein n=1 Tax=Phytophthora rubi TaxID=129364 RepID=A0A6A4G3Y1_9STRA|nr:hypothetical protein PR001_g5551 [Phytophthora rubi]KAE9349722.1 hypothetical protein PR003_g5743 [Phytophthora rubi]
MGSSLTCYTWTGKCSTFVCIVLFGSSHRANGTFAYDTNGADMFIASVETYFVGDGTVPRVLTSQAAWRVPIASRRSECVWPPGLWFRGSLTPQSLYLALYR